MKDSLAFRNALNELIAKHSKDYLAKEDGMVTQVWSDGEVTSTKSGSLLGQRTLHMSSEGFIKTSTWNKDNVQIMGMEGDWPHWKDMEDGTRYGFIYTDDIGVAELCELMVKYNIFDTIRRTTLAGMKMIPFSVSYKEGDKKLSSMQVAETWIKEQLKEQLEPLS